MKNTNETTTIVLTAMQMADMMANQATSLEALIAQAREVQASCEKSRPMLPIGVAGQGAIYEVGSDTTAFIFKMENKLRELRASQQAHMAAHHRDQLSRLCDLHLGGDDGLEMARAYAVRHQLAAPDAIAKMDAVGLRALHGFGVSVR